ncbi:MAG TPA: VWA domain-containing protein [Thermoanaerobaculia bacterium]|nr:VWA domain-containing protein [Thermoanaerobaculia bacterium]
MVPWIVLAALATGDGVVAQESLPPADTPPVLAQEEPQAEFLDAIDVKVVNVYVYVRDKQGNPITGLTAEDFRLLENKRPVPISNFYEVAGGTRIGEEDVPEPSQLERIQSNPELDPRIPQVPPDQRLWMVLYVDHFNIRPHNRNRVFNFVREFLRNSLGRDDRVMLVTYNRSLKVERNFTSDSQLISRALFDLERHTGGRTQMDSERRDLLRDIQEARDDLILQSRVKLFAESQFNDLQFTLDALKEMVDMLGGIPGRKALVYVSDGLPMRAGEDLFVAAAERYPETLSGLRLESMQYDAGRRYRDIASTAASNQVAFYTIDAQGLLGRSDRSAEYGSYHWSPEVESIAASNMQQPLMFLADYTGGQAIVNTNNFALGFEKFGRDFSHYYSLGYTPAHGGTGRQHDLKVEVVGVKGADVRSRRSYRDKPVEREMQEATLAALQFGVQQNEIGIRVVPRESIRRTDGTYLVHVDLRIPWEGVTLLPSGDVHRARVRVWIQAGDAKGRLSEPQVADVPMELRSEDLELAKGKFFVYQLPLQMREGDQRLSITVRDDLAARSSFVTQTFRVGS